MKLSLFVTNFPSYLGSPWHRHFSVRLWCLSSSIVLCLELCFKAQMLACTGTAIVGSWLLPALRMMMMMMH
jgi:hypothetical protein